MSIDPIDVSAGPPASPLLMTVREPRELADRALPETKQVHEAGKADRVEISDVGKQRSPTTEQQDDRPELQLPPDKLREMAAGGDTPPTE